MNRYQETGWNVGYTYGGALLRIRSVGGPEDGSRDLMVNALACAPEGFPTGLTPEDFVRLADPRARTARTRIDLIRMDGEVVYVYVLGAES